MLLHVFRTHKHLWSTTIPARNLKQEIGETMLALAEACIRCARHSHQLLTDCWIDGSFAIFDYTYTQYLFSATTILAISSLSVGRSDQEEDRDSFEYAYQFIDQLKRNGNFAAVEFWRHVDHIRVGMLEFSSKIGRVDPQNGLVGGSGDGAAGMAATASMGSGSASIGGALQHASASHLSLVYGSGTSSSTPLNTDYQSTMTTEMALAEPSLQEFLSQADLDLGFLDTSMHESGYQSLYVHGVPPSYEAWDTS